MERTLHRRIRTEIETAILSGAWPAGHRIPYEHELMARHGCSRMTVSKAISALVDAGLIERRRRAGSFVARPRAHSAVLEIPDIEAVVRGRGERYGYALLHRRVRAPARRKTEETDLAGRGKLIEIACVHTGDDRPFVFEYRLIALASAPEAAMADFKTLSPGAWLMAHVPWTEAEHRIGAIGADAETARRLKIKRGAACLSLERWTWRGSERITYARQLFPGHAYDLVAHFTRG